jgi:hypothetical protein
VAGFGQFGLRPAHNISGLLRRFHYGAVDPGFTVRLESRTGSCADSYIGNFRRPWRETRTDQTGCWSELDWNRRAPSDASCGECRAQLDRCVKWGISWCLSGSLGRAARQIVNKQAFQRFVCAKQEFARWHRVPPEIRCRRGLTVQIHLAPAASLPFARLSLQPPRIAELGSVRQAVVPKVRGLRRPMGGTRLHEARGTSAVTRSGRRSRPTRRSSGGCHVGRSFPRSGIC